MTDIRLTQTQATRSAPATETGPRVLLVDPDAGRRSLTQVALARRGFEVAPAQSGAEAVALARMAKTPPAAIIIAEQTQGTEAQTTCAQLRGEPKTQRAPIIYLSDRPELANDVAMAMGADYVFGRPQYARDLVAVVELLTSTTTEGAFDLHSSDVPLAYAIRALLATRANAVVSAVGGRGVIKLEKGTLVDAQFDGRSTLDALLKLVVTCRGEFRVMLTRPTAPFHFELSLSGYDMLVRERLRAFETIVRHSAPLEARLQVHFPALLEALSTLPDEVNDIVKLFDGHRPLWQVLLDSPIEERTALEVASRLYSMGIVTPVETKSTADEFAKAPALFEPAPRAAEESLIELFGKELPTAAIPNTPEVFTDWYEEVRPSALDLMSEEERWHAVNAPSAFAMPLQMEREAALGSQATGPLAQFGAGQALRLTEEMIVPTLARAAQEAADRPPSGSELDAEQEFFARGHALQPSVSEAVLGRPLGTPEKTETRRDSTVIPMLVAAALVTALVGGLGVAISAARRGNEVTPVPPATFRTPTATPRGLSNLQEQSMLENATTLYATGALKPAIATLEKLTTGAPSNGQAWLLLSLARLDDRQLDAAEEAAHTALAIAPTTTARAYLVLATIAEAKGHKVEMRNSLREYLKLEPKGENADEARALLGP